MSNILVLPFALTASRDNAGAIDIVFPPMQETGEKPVPLPSLADTTRPKVAIQGEFAETDAPLTLVLPLFTTFVAFCLPSVPKLH